MGDSISSKISRGGGGPSKKSISLYILLFFMVFLCRRQMLKLS